MVLRVLLLLRYLNKISTQKLKELSPEITEREIERNEKEKLLIQSGKKLELSMIKDPKRLFKENKSYFANPNFSTLMPPSQRLRGGNKSILIPNSPFKAFEIPERK